MFLSIFIPLFSIEDKIFAINENLRSLKDELSDVMLEYNYLSSTDKLNQYQIQYFDNNMYIFIVLS